MTRSPGHEITSARTSADAKGRSIGRISNASLSAMLGRRADLAPSRAALSPARWSRIHATPYWLAMAAAPRSSVTILTRAGSTSAIDSFNVWFSSRSQNSRLTDGSRQPDKRDLPALRFLHGIRMCMALRLPSQNVVNKSEAVASQIDAVLGGPHYCLCRQHCSARSGNHLYAI